MKLLINLLVFIVLSASVIDAYKINEEGCGERSNSKSKSFLDVINQNHPKIVGGQPAKEHSWPWQVGLYLNFLGKKMFFCGGSLINKRFVLTAAHCYLLPIPIHLLDKQFFTVRVGDHYLSKKEGQEVEIERFFVHPKYENPTPVSNDIALIKLAKDLKWSETVRPVCVAGKELDADFGPETTFIVTGWGMTHENDNETSDVLQEVEVKGVKHAECKEKYDTAFEGELISEGMLCAADTGKDSCQGDSGGPLVKENEGRYYQHGIVSFGMGCARPDFPGVYTRIASYWDWVVETIK